VAIVTLFKTPAQDTVRPVGQWHRMLVTRFNNSWFERISADLGRKSVLRHRGDEAQVPHLSG
jgi:hypothetical protein